MSNLNFKKEFKPRFKIGETIWELTHNSFGPTTVVKQTIRTIILENYNIEGVDFYITKGYTTDIWNYDNEDNTIEWADGRNFYRTEKEALKEAKWTPVDLPYSGYKAIGIDVNGDRINEELQDCALGMCCADISVVRDLLIRCFICKGLCKKDIDTIKHIKKSHPINISDGLKNLFGALGIV
jgi:hypothetical protein